MSRIVVALVAVAAAWLGLVVSSGDQDKATIKVVSQSAVLDRHLGKVKEVIGDDYEGYRNHNYRVLSYSLHLLNGNETYRKDIEAALAYHDVGLWTDQALAYIDPSVEAARKALAASYIDSPERLELVLAIIRYHHKVTPYSGPWEDVVNAVRKSDLIDFSLGVVANGMSRNDIARVMAAIPNNGFHRSLMRLQVTLPRPWSIVEIFYW